MSEATAALLGDNGAAPQGVAPTEQPSPGSVWSASLDDETKSYVSNKGWKEPTDILMSYRNLEKFAGGSKNLVELPGDGADETALAAFYSRLGRPDDPEKYGLEVPEGGSPELVDWFKSAAFKHGLSQKQAASLYSEWNGMSGEMQEKLESQRAQSAETELKALKGEWGQAYDKMIGAGRRAASALGYDAGKLSAIEERLGTGEMMRLFATLGSKMGEDEFVGDRDPSGGFGVTPAAAQQQINDLKMDKDFMAQYLKGTPEAVSKMKRLMEAAHGGV